MRTSYNRREGNSAIAHPNEPNISYNSAIEEGMGSDEKVAQDLIISGFTEVRNALDTKFATPPKEVSEGDIVQDTQSPNLKKAKKKSKKWLLFVIIGVVVSAIVVGSLIISGVISLPGSNSNGDEPVSETYKPQYKKIAKTINNFYLDETKSEVSDECTSEALDAVYDLLEEAEANGENISDLESEVDTLVSYLQDRYKISVYEDVSCDLSSDDVLSSMLSVKSSADKYSVSGLQGSVYSRVNSIIAVREEYLRIKSSLLGVSDLMSFDGSVYSDSIGAIKYTRNAEELSLLLAKVSADSTVVRAEAMLEAVKGTEAEAEAILALENAKKAQTNANDSWERFNTPLVDNPQEELSGDIEGDKNENS